MTVVIRMKRTGRRNRPCYRISVADRRFPRDGRTLENLGLYDPISSNPEAQVTLKHAGINDVANVDGGMAAIKQSGVKV